MEKTDLRIVFMGTPEFAVGTLSALVEGGYNVVGVVTQPDKAVGRHHDTLQSPPVKQYAEAHGLPVLQPERMKDELFVSELASWKADVQVVVAFRMLPEVVWSMPRWGTFNVHASLLPQYRGAAPIQWAIANGETVTGVTTFMLDHEIDTGRIIMQKEQPLPADADAEWLYERLMKLGAQAALETLDLLIEGDGNVPTTAQAELQAGELRPAPKIFKQTCCLDFTLKAKQVYDFIRAMSPHPGAWTMIDGGQGGQQVLKVYKSELTDKPSAAPVGELVVEGRNLYVCCSDLMLRLVEVQPAGKRRMAAADFINGWRK
jgi:methionyl-tRNA formyltransferase